MRPIAMREPEIKTLSLCPACFQKNRQTAEICAHCGVERHFGPTRREALVATLIGFAAGPFLAILILGPSYWAIPLSAVGGLLGFFICQIRHNGDRWMKER
ncbi:hypothetical protein [Brytella acorum]|uniref:Uncharacterized protein n=1 Tax=Brytella acorum TaxID=2959299 RepID=A0AA35Y402_9PROT|nr:hypothetical protein [Brytella acorum]MDF3623521.1 hypothetical protein [Brytella acorum]CAI9121346.1 hypothetical protein LMG32879_002193 [Brytella acorum]